MKATVVNLEDWKRAHRPVRVVEASLPLQAMIDAERAWIAAWVQFWCRPWL